MAENSPPATILVVDDDEGLLRLILKSLRREGYQTAGAVSGQEAMAWLNRNRADLLLLDLKLPDMPGQQIINQLAESEHRVPFIVITGQGDERAAVEVMKQGAVDYLVKDREFLEFVPAVVRRSLAQLENAWRLAAAEDALRKNEAKYRALLNAMPDLMFRLNRAGDYLDFHAERAADLAMPSAEIIGTNIRNSPLPPAAIRKSVAAIQRALETGEMQSFEYSLPMPAGPRDYEARVVASGKDEVVVIVRNITERKRAELRQSVQDAATRALAESATLAEAAPRILRVFCERLGWDLGELWSVDQESRLLRCVETWHPPGISFAQFSAVTRPATFAPGIGLPGRVWAEGTSIWVPDVVCDAHFCRPAEAAREDLHGAFGFPVLLGPDVLGVMAFFSREIREPDRDLLEMFSAVGSQIGQFIERKRLEKEILRISELEQKRIGHDLHDGLCQHLAGIEFMSQVLQQRLAAKSRAEAASAAEIARLVRQAISQTRDLARGLSPVVLESQGLMSALEELAASTEKVFKIDCVFQCDTPVLVHDNTVATHLYRIAQEAVGNAVKHGRARRVTLTLTSTPECVVLAVRDNGAGMPETMTNVKGMGLHIMHYRAAIIGASLAIQKEPGNGTAVICSLRSKPAESSFSPMI